MAKQLDYDLSTAGIRQYHLVVQAQDGKYSNDTNVIINVLNVNDMKPRFGKDRYEITLNEEEVRTHSIFKVTAIDPDIEQPGVPQNISYSLDATNDLSKHFSIDEKSGELRIVRPLDRARPNGFPKWNMFVSARDNNGEGKNLESFAEVIITLNDVNDHPPHLDMPDGLVWYENEPPGLVEPQLKAEDYDEEKNGPPFRFDIDPEEASSDIQSKFEIVETGGAFWLKARTELDREENKEYDIPVRIADNLGLSATSVLRLVVGDRNDNPMAAGASEIFVYDYEGRAPDTEIGRVYVTDPDDWDLPDKKFKMVDPVKFPYFSLNRDTGMITMKVHSLDSLIKYCTDIFTDSIRYVQRNIELREEKNVYNMRFRVEDATHQQVGVFSYEKCNSQWCIFVRSP